MIRKLAVYAAIVLSAFVVSCDHIVTATVEDPELCKIFPDMEFPGAGFFGGIVTTVNTSFVFDVGSDLPKLNKEHQTSDIRVQSLTMIPKTASLDLSTIQKLKLDVGPGKEGSTLPVVNVIDYDKAALEVGDAGEVIDPAADANFCAEGVPPLEPFTPESCIPKGSGVFVGNGENNISPYIDEQFVDFKVSVTMPLPEDAWKVDVMLCFYVAAKYER